MYWYNIDTNKINSLPSYLNELERYVYDNDNESYDSIIQGIQSYVQKYENVDADDKLEARYEYKNYLVKDLTGLDGKFKLSLTCCEELSNIIKLCVKRTYINEDDETQSDYYNATNENDCSLTLDKNDINATLYIQL